MIYSLFNATRDLFVDNGTVKLGCMEPEYKEAISTLSRWFDEGLLDNNYISTDDSMLTYNILNGVTGATIAGGGGDMGKWLSALKNNGSDVELMGITYPKKADGQYSNQVLVGDYYPQNSCVAITTNCKNPALAAKWLDFGYSAEGLTLNNFGIEGKSFEMIDDYPTFTDNITNPAEGRSMGQAMSNFCRSASSGAFIQDRRYIEQYYGTDTQRSALNEWLKSYETSKPYRMPAVTLTSEESSEYSGLWTEITKYRDEQTVAFITGSKPLSEYDEFLEGLKKLNVEKALEYQQAAYDRFMSRK